MSSSPGEAQGGRGLLFIVSAPSGTGKTTLVERLVQVVPNLRMSRSYTSRPARAGEQDGVDYNFISRDRFEAHGPRGRVPRVGRRVRQLLRHRRGGHRALPGGRARTWCSSSTSRARGRCAAAGIETVGIFVLPPSAAVLEQRLRGRSKDSEEQIRRRLEVARREVGEFAQYEYVVVNDELEAAVERLRAIVLAERARVKPMRPAAEKIIGRSGNRERQVWQRTGSREHKDIVERAPKENRFEFVVLAGAARAPAAGGRRAARDGREEDHHRAARSAPAEGREGRRGERLELQLAHPNVWELGERKGVGN